MQPVEGHSWSAFRSSRTDELPELLRAMARGHNDAGCLDARIDAFVHVGEACQATDRDDDQTGVVGECSWNVESSRSESGQCELARKTERHERNGRLRQADPACRRAHQRQQRDDRDRDEGVEGRAGPTDHQGRAADVSGTQRHRDEQQSGQCRGGSGNRDPELRPLLDQVTVPARCTAGSSTDDERYPMRRAIPVAAARPVSPARGRGWRSLLGNEELDREANRSLRLDEVLDIGRDGLRLSRVDDDVGHRRRLGHEAQTALIDSQPAPRPAGHPVGSAQCGRHGVFVPRRRGSHDDEVGG